MGSSEWEGLLERRLAMLPGSRDPGGGPILIIPLPQDPTGHDSGGISATVKYLKTIPSVSARDRGWVVVVDARLCHYRLVKPTVSTVRATLGHIRHLFVVRPEGFWDKQRVDCRKSEVDSQPIYVSVSKLTRHMEVSQLPVELGGTLDYDHQGWLKTRKAYEEFVDECERARRDLETLQVELRREEPCSRASTLHDLLSVNTNTYNTITARPAVIFNMGQEVLKVLEMDEESGFRVCEGQGDAAEAASRVRAMLHDLHLLTTAVEACWRRLNTALDTYMQVRELENEMNEIGKWLVSAGQTLLAETSIGTNTDQAEALLREHEAIELKCRETYGKWAGLRYRVEDALDRGDGDLRALADHRTTTTDLRSLKDYTDILVRTFASRLDRRRTLILASVRFHRIAHQMGERCSVLLQQQRWILHTDDVDTLKKTLRELIARKEAIDYLASEGTRAGEKLLDLLTVGVKDLSGRDITPDYTGELNHVHALLTAVHEHYARAARQADLNKLRLQQNIQLLTCQRDVKQAHKWLKALLEALVKAHSHVGRSSEEIRRLKTEHQHFQETAAGTFEYGYESARAALLVEKSAGNSVTSESRKMVGDLESVWKIFLQGSQEQLTRLRVAGVFFRTMEQHLERLDNLCANVVERMGARTLGPDCETRSFLSSRDRLLREIGRNVRLGKLLKERLLDPLVPSFSFREHNENLLAQESISERIQHITNRAQQLDALMFPAASTAHTTPATPADTQARSDSDQERSGSSEYWTCSECTCSTSASGSYHTCPECQQLLDLFTHDDTRPPSEEDLPLDDILRRRSRSRSKSKSKSKDDVSQSKSKSRSRSRTRSRSHSMGKEIDADKATITTLPLVKVKREAPQDHPDAIERARSRSRSRSKSLTREIVASFKEFRDKVTRGRSRSKSAERQLSEDYLELPAEAVSEESHEGDGTLPNGGLHIPVQKPQEPLHAPVEVHPVPQEIPHSPVQVSPEPQAEPTHIPAPEDPVRVPVHVQTEPEESPRSPDSQKGWQEVSSETVRTRVVVHAGESKGDRTLTLEQVTSLRKPHISDSYVFRDSIRTSEDAKAPTLPPPPLPPPPEESKVVKIKEPVKTEPETSSTSDQPDTSSSPAKSGTSPDISPLPPTAPVQETEVEEAKSPHPLGSPPLVEPLPPQGLPPPVPHSNAAEDLLKKMRKSAEWLELRVVELTPGMVYLGATLEEASQLLKAHEEVLTKLQSKQSPVEDLLNQADQLISTQRPRAEVYAAMAESLGLAWKDLNSQLETRKQILDMGVAFHTRARQYSDAMDLAERAYADNVMPNDAEGARQLLSSLHDHKRTVLEASMYTLQEAQALLARLRGLTTEGATLDSRPLHIKTNIEFACSQIEHYLESLHDRRRFLDGLFSARKHHLEQCLALCLLYQDLTEAVTALKQLRDEVSEHRGLGESQANAEILLHEHQKREAAAKEQQDKCIRYLATAEKMASGGHYAGLEARSRAYSVLEAATALHETCDTRTSLLQQSILFFRLAQTALTKLDQAEVQVAGLAGEGAQRLSLVLGVVEEAVQPALTEGYAILEVTGGRHQPHNIGVSLVVEELERRRSHLSSICVSSTEQVLHRTELSNAFLEQYNAIESWLVRIGDAFLQGHQDPGGSLSLAKDFLHLHQTLNHDVMEKKNEIDSLNTFLEQLLPDLSEEEIAGHKEKMQALIDHWNSLKRLLDIRTVLSEQYVKFHEDAEAVNNEHEALELLLKEAQGEEHGAQVEAKWDQVQKLYLDLCNTGKAFCQDARKVEDPYLDSNRAILCVEMILEQLGKRRLVITDLHSHFHMKITTTKEMITLWNTYRENVNKMKTEMLGLENDFCPLLRGDTADPEGMANTLDQRLNIFTSAVKKSQEEIQTMMTRAEVMSYKGDQTSDRDEIISSLLQLYQNLQNKATEYQILGHMLIQWCRNIAEIHRSCDKLEGQFGNVSLDIGGVEGQLREHEASKQAVMELLKFAQNEAASIMSKIKEQCPPAAGAQDVATIEEMLERRGKAFEDVWVHHQQMLERQLKRSQYHVDLQVISDQLRDLSEQLSRMRGHYGDSLAAATNMQTAFTQFQLTVDMLERRIQTFVSTAVKMLGPDDDSGEVQEELAELERKWSTFQMQVGQSKKSIELSIDFYRLVEKAEDWFKEGSKLLVAVAGESSSIQTPDEAERLRSRIEHFLEPGQEAQEQRITKISSLALQLYGDAAPKQIEVVSHQNTHMIESFTVIRQNLTMMVTNLKAANEHRERQQKEQEEMAASLAAAQAEAEAAKLAAAAAEEAKKAAEEVARTMSIPVEPIVIEKVEMQVQTEAIPLPEEEEDEISKQDDVPPPKKAKLIDDEPQPMPPIFITPLVGATVTEGVKFSFECKIMGMPMPEVEWLKDNMNITDNPDYKTSFEEGTCTLTIEETFTEDTALFTCKAVNAAGMAESSATLTVKEAEPVEVLSPPVFTKKLADCTAQEGSSFQLEATVDGHPLPVVSWSKDGSCVDESPDYVITFNNGECVLRFEEVFLEDQADYSCKATNDLGEDSTKAKLTVSAVALSERPKFSMPLSNVMARAGQKFKLECHVTGTPTPTVTWFHNNKPVKETPDCRITFDGSIATLVMSEAFPKNAGTYAVVAKNSAGEGQCSANVSVKGRIPTETSDSEVTSDVDIEPVKPSVQLSLKDTTVKEGKTARLDCVIIGQPEPEVIWYHDETPVKESNDFKLLFHGDRCSLIIQEAFLEDAGIYRVVAMNSAGETSTACFLNVEPTAEEPPPEPTAVAPRFSLLLADSHVTEGKPVTLRATVSGQPKPTIAWFREGVPLIQDNELQIHESVDGNVSLFLHSASLDHTGQYEVVASNSAGTAKCVAYLSIEPRLPTPPPVEYVEAPVFSRLLKDATVASGNSVKFEAEVDGQPKPTVQWSLNDSRITGQEFLRGHLQYMMGECGNVYTLELPTTSMLQAGRVTVVAENVAGKAVSAALLDIVEPPAVAAKSPPAETKQQPFFPQQQKEETHISTSTSTSSSTMSHHTTIMETTHITKVISGGGGDADVKKHSVAATSTAHVKKVSGQPTVEVHGAHLQEVKQEGDVSPVVSDKVSIVKMEGDKVTQQITQDTQIAPTSPPIKKIAPVKKKVSPAKFVTPLQGAIAKEGERVVLECLIEGHPNPSVTWTHNGGPVSSDCKVEAHLNKASLEIPHVNQSHSGHYTCAIENEGGSAQCMCDVIVKKTQFPPVISKRLQPTVVGINERLYMEIDVSGTPTPQVKWTKDGHPLPASDHVTLRSEGTRHLLIIQDALPEDSGRYGATATNSAGRAESLADVMVMKMGADQSPTTHKIVFTDITDDAKRESETVEEGHVKTIKRAIEEVAVEAPSPSSPVKVLKAPPKPSKPQPPALPTPPVLVQSEPESDREEEIRKPPGKLRKSWPPLPSDDDVDVAPKIDTSVEITSRNVSSIISSFSAMSETQSVGEQHKSIRVPAKARPIAAPPSEPDIQLQPEPEPEYGFIAISEQVISQPQAQEVEMRPSTLVSPTEPVLVPEPEPECEVEFTEQVLIPEPEIVTPQEQQMEVEEIPHFYSDVEMKEEYSIFPVHEPMKVLSPIPEVVPEPVAKTPEPLIMEPKLLPQEPAALPTPEPQKVPTPEPPKVPTPEPPKVPTPEPPKVPTPEPPKVPTPEPPKVPTPEPPKVLTPEPPKVLTPEPLEVSTPEPQITPKAEPLVTSVPEAQVVISPEAQKILSPEPAQISSPTPERITEETVLVSITDQAPPEFDIATDTGPSDSEPRVVRETKTETKTVESRSFESKRSVSKTSYSTVETKVFTSGFTGPFPEKPVEVITEVVPQYEAPPPDSTPQPAVTEYDVPVPAVSESLVDTDISKPGVDIDTILTAQESQQESEPYSDEGPLEYFVPENDQVIEFIPVPSPSLAPQEPSSEPEPAVLIPEMSKESIIKPEIEFSKPFMPTFEGTKATEFTSKSVTSHVSSSSYTSTSSEMQKMFVSSSNVETKVFKQTPSHEPAQPADVFSQQIPMAFPQPVAAGSLPPATFEPEYFVPKPERPERQPLQPLVIPQPKRPDQITIEETVKPPIHPEREDVREKKPKKKRESVIQIAKRLEDTIIPMSPDEVPGGVRLLPSPKQPSTPVRETPTPTREVASARATPTPTTEEQMPLHVKGEKFPELEPFPFTIMERPKRERPKSLPPPMPKKFVPGAFTDSEYESDMEVDHRVELKRIRFEASPKPSPRPASVGKDPLPPSAFEPSPVFGGGMRPDVLKKEEEVVKDKPKSVTPKKKSKIAEKFLASAGESAEEKIVKPIPMRPKKPDVISPPADILPPKQKPLPKVKKPKDDQPPPLTEETREIVNVEDMKKPAKLAVSWPPQPGAEVAASTDSPLPQPASDGFVKKISTMTSFSDTRSQISSIKVEKKETKVTQQYQTPAPPVVPEPAAFVLKPEPAPVYEQMPEPSPVFEVKPEPSPVFVLEPEPMPVYVQEPEPTPVLIPEPSPVYVPEPAPVYAVDPEPAPEYVQEPEPAPEYVLEPEPAPEYVLEPEPAPEYVLEPEPAPEYVLEPEPAPEYVLEPEPAPEYVLEPEPAPEYALQQEPAQEYVPEPETIPIGVSVPETVPVCIQEPETVMKPKPPQVSEGVTTVPTPVPGFRPVRAPTPKRGQTPAKYASPSPAPPPPFDLVCEVSSKPETNAKEKSSLVAKSDERRTTARIEEHASRSLTVSTKHSEVSKKSVIKVATAGKKTPSWPPKSEENAMPSWKIRSQSAERPPVTEPVALPTRPHEAPPSIYWSSNITLQEKRTSWPQPPPQMSTTINTSTVQKAASRTTKEEILKTSQEISQSSTKKQVRIDAPVGNIKTVPVKPVSQRRPTPAAGKLVSPAPVKVPVHPPIQEIPKRLVKPKVVSEPPVPVRESSVVSPIIQLPPLEPFPFEVEEERGKRPRGRAPSMPKKFVPRTFTESEYESDYDFRSDQASRLYMSDSEATGYKPMNIRMKKGRTKKPKGPSPPPPSTLGLPLPFGTPVMNSSFQSDIDSDIPTSKESTPVPESAYTKSKHIIKTVKSLASQITPESKSGVIPAAKPAKTKAVAAPVAVAQPTPAPKPKPAPAAPSKPAPVIEDKPIPVGEPKLAASSIVTTSECAAEARTETTDQHVRGVIGMRKRFEGGTPPPLPQSVVVSPRGPSPAPVQPVPLLQGGPLSPVFRAPSPIGTSAAQMSSTPAIPAPTTDAATVRIIPVVQETTGDKVQTSSHVKTKPSSPKSRKKAEPPQVIAQELEESGYVADTEGTLPRRHGKVGQVGSSSHFSSSSTSYSKTESFMSSSFSKSEKSFSSSEFNQGSSSFPAGSGLPPGGGFPSGSFPFSPTPASSVGQTSHFSSSFKSSESKSSQMFTSRSEEVYEERRGDKDPKTARKSPSPKREKAPKFEEFVHETRGQPGAPGPFSEDTYYAMKDESDVSTDTGRTQKKVEVKSETHVEVMSDKKVEVFESTSVDVSPEPTKKHVVKTEQKIKRKAIEEPKPKKETPRPLSKPPEESLPSHDITITTEVRGGVPSDQGSIQETVTTKSLRQTQILEERQSSETRSEKVHSVSESVKLIPPEREYKAVKEEKPVSQAKVPETEPLKSTGLVKQAVIKQDKDGLADLKPFPYIVEAEKPKKPRGEPPSHPSKFVKGEFHESDYESEYEGRIPSKWKPADSDTEDFSYSQIKAPTCKPKVSLPRERTPTPPTEFGEPEHFEGPPRPKIDFPESEPEPEREISPEVVIPEKIEIISPPEPPKITPKEPKIFKSQPQKKEPPKRSPSPVLQPGTPPEEDYIEPPPKQKPEAQPQQSPFANAIGVESTKITKIADSSKYHQRFVTMQQTTRVIKFSDTRTGTTTSETQQTVAHEPKMKPTAEKETFKETLKEPLPALEPFPFTPEPARPKKDRGAPPSKPKKFHKGDFTESDYESDYEGRIKPKWQPSDSDAEDPNYGKVKPRLRSGRTPSSSRERIPTPPTVFDTPPETGGPWRPTIEQPEIILKREPTPEVLLITETMKKIEPQKVAVKLTSEKVKKPVVRPESPPLPPPGTPPEEGIITEETQYVVDKVDVKSRLLPPPMREIQTYEDKPYTKITERTEKTITDLKMEEELRMKKERLETIKTVVTDYEEPPERPPPPEEPEQIIVELEKFPDLEPFPFEPEKPKLKREKGPPPPKPSKFVKGEFRESDYDSDYEGRVRPRWKPVDSDAEDPEYTPVRPPPPTDRRPSKSKERTPTPPTLFDVPPVSDEPLRPIIEPIDKTPVMTVREPSPEIIIPKVEEKITKIPKVTPKAPPLKPKEPEVQKPKEPSPPLPEPGPQPEIGYVPAQVLEIKEEEDAHIRMIKKKIESKKGFQIDIDITDIYDFVSDSDAEKPETEARKQHEPFPQLEPFPYAPDPAKPKRQRGPPPPQPKKFLKGEFRGSDYESDYDAPIAPKWAPPESEGEEHSYRRVRPPVGEIGKQRSESVGKEPSPPSKFDQPPQFEGPPRPVVELSDLPRRERRESLEEYSIPRFPKVEFKPFDLEDEVVGHPRGGVTTDDTETEAEAHHRPASSTKGGIDRKYAKSAQKVVSHQFEDMTQTFRHKAQKFAEQLVTEVFAAREGSVPAEPAGEPPSLPEELKARSVSPDSTDIPPPSSTAAEEQAPEPQAYRDESRLSEFGTKHIDPDTGLIYFKYDFGYEFGIILPGEGKPVKKKEVNGDRSSDIAIPVIHEKSDASSKGQETSVKTNGHIDLLETEGEQDPPTATVGESATSKSLSSQDLKADHISPQPSLQSDISETDREYQQYMGKMIPEFVPKKHAQFRPISGDPYSDSEAELDHPSPSKISVLSPDMPEGPKRFVPVVPGAAVQPKPQPFQGVPTDPLYTTTELGAPTRPDSGGRGVTSTRVRGSGRPTRAGDLEQGRGHPPKRP